MGPGQKILIICEDVKRAIRLETPLRADHYEVLRARTGAEALDKYESWNAELVICDHQPAGMSEMQIVEAIRRINRRARFIFIVPKGSDLVIGEITPNRVIAHLREDCNDEDLLTQVRRGFGVSDNFYNRRSFSRFKLSIDSQCILINPFNNSESRPMPGLIRDVSRSGLSMLVRQVIPVPAMLKLIIELPQTRQSITMLAKSLSCTLTQMPNVYRLGAKFVGLLPPEMEEAIGEMDDGPSPDNTDIFIGKSFRRAVKEWLTTHQDDIEQLRDSGTALPRIAEEVGATPNQTDSDV